MAKPIVVTVDQERVNAALNLLGREAPAAIRRSLKRAGASVRVEAIRVVQDELTLKVDRIRRGIKISNVAGRDYVDIRASGAPVGLVHFKANIVRIPGLPREDGRRGVTVQVKKGRARKRVRGGFVAIMPNKHRGVFTLVGGRRGVARRVKTGKNVGKLYKPELPIRERYSTTIAQVLNNRYVIDRLLRHGSTRVKVELTHEIRFRLTRRIK